MRGRVTGSWGRRPRAEGLRGVGRACVLGFDACWKSL